MVPNSLIKHETLTITDMVKEENLGMALDKAHFNYLIHELVERCHALDDGFPTTHIITTKGIQDGAELQGL